MSDPKATPTAHHTGEFAGVQVQTTVQLSLSTESQNVATVSACVGGAGLKFHLLSHSALANVSVLGGEHGSVLITHLPVHCAGNVQLTSIL